MKTKKKILIFAFTLLLTGCISSKIDSNKYITFDDNDDIINLKFDNIKKIAKQDENLTLIDLSEKYDWKAETIYITQKSKEHSSNRSYGFVYNIDNTIVNLSISTYNSFLEGMDELVIDDIFINETTKKEIIDGVIYYVSDLVRDNDTDVRKITFIKNERTYDISVYSTEQNYRDYTKKIYEAYR